MQTPSPGRRVAEWMLVVLTLLVVLTIGIQIALWGFVRGPRELRARAFVLTDASGSEIARLQNGPNGALLHLKRGGQDVFVGALDPKEMGVAISLDDRAAAGLFSNVDGSEAITLYGRTTATTASMALVANEPMVVLKSPQATIGMIAVPGTYFRVAEGTRVLFQVPQIDAKSR